MAETWELIKGLGWAGYYKCVRSPSGVRHPGEIISF